MAVGQVTAGNETQILSGWQEVPLPILQLGHSGSHGPNATVLLIQGSWIKLSFNWSKGTNMPNPQLSKRIWDPYLKELSFLLTWLSQVCLLSQGSPKGWLRSHHSQPKQKLPSAYLPYSLALGNLGPGPAHPPPAQYLSASTWSLLRACHVAHPKAAARMPSPTNPSLKSL